MQSSDYWSVQAGNKNPSKTHRTGYHTNHRIWTQQIAGFGCQRHSQIPPLIPKRPPKTINTHTPPTLRPTLQRIQRTRQRKEGWTCISFFACLRKGWTPVRQLACQGYSLMPPKAFTHRSLERMAEWEWGGVKRKILANLLFIGRGFSFQGSFIEAFPNTSLSLSALTSANQRAWVQDFLGKRWRISETIANESTVTMA